MRSSAISRLARSALSWLPLTGLVEPPRKPQGISAILRVWNERDWLEACVDSVYGEVDEIVAVDTGSTDGSLELLRRLAADRPKLKVFSCADSCVWDFSNYALERCNFRWVLKWDADFVASGLPASPLAALRRYLFSLDPRRYHYLNPVLVELTGDFGHQFPGLRLRRDMEVFTCSDAARYVPVERSFTEPPYPVKLPRRMLPDIFKVRMEGLRLPRYYAIGEFSEPVGYHINIKPALRHLLGYFYLQWLGEARACSPGGLEAYALEQVVKKWGVPGLPQAASLYMRHYAAALERYDPALGPLPGNVARLAAGSGYEVIYEGGKPVNRRETGQRAQP